jgi:formylglycine-generating enzyme required for sulfatase activity
VHPVVGVNWDDAKAFCKWLTAKELQAGRLKAGQQYRLPHDWEWSVAVGLREDKNRSPREKDAAVEKVYPWGHEWPPPNDSGNYADYESKDADWPEKWTPIDNFRDGFARTAPVGSFRANDLGIYDLGGNVWEWCEDSYDGTGATRVLRGGAWVSFGSKRLLSSYRTSNGAGYRYASCGFRIVVAGLVID